MGTTAVSQEAQTLEGNLESRLDAAEHTSMTEDPGPELLTNEQTPVATSAAGGAPTYAAPGTDHITKEQEESPK